MRELQAGTEGTESGSSTARWKRETASVRDWGGLGFGEEVET